MKKLVLIATILGMAQLASAAKIDIWQGHGELFDIRGNSQGTYLLRVKTETVSESERSSEITVTSADRGEIKVEKCRSTDSDKGWMTTCDNGLSGGGVCYGEGLCQSYLEKAASAFATTIVFDSRTEMRLLRTELQGGQAVRVFREKLSKQ